MSTLYVSQKKGNMNSRNQRRKPLSPENIRSGIIKRGSSRRLLPQRRTKRTTRRETTQQQEREREREGLEYNSGGMTIKRYTKTTNGGHNGVIPALRCAVGGTMQQAVHA